MSDYEKLAETLERLAAKATGGTWSERVVDVDASDIDSDDKLKPVGYGLDYRDAALIVALVNAVPTITAALRECAKMREALLPFALHAAEQLDHYIPPAIAACDATPIWGGSFGDRTEVTVGDFKRARAAIRAMEE